MAGSKDGRFVATAQGATHWSAPKIMVWNPADVLRQHPTAVEAMAEMSGWLQERLVSAQTLTLIFDCLAG